MSDYDAKYCADADLLIAKVVHYGAHHQELGKHREFARELGAITTTQPRAGYACWIVARTMATAAASRGAQVNVMAGRPSEDGTTLVPSDIDDAVPLKRAAVRMLRAAANADRDTAIAVFKTVPLEDIDDLLVELLTVTIDVARVMGWGAHA